MYSGAHRGPRELYFTGVPLTIPATTLVLHAPWREDPFLFEEEAADTTGFCSQGALLWSPSTCEQVLN